MQCVRMRFLTGVQFVLIALAEKKCRNVLKSLHFVGRAEVKRWKLCFLFMCLSSFDYIEIHFPNWGFIFFPASFLSFSRMNKKNFLSILKRTEIFVKTLKVPTILTWTDCYSFSNVSFWFWQKCPEKKTFQVIILNHCYWLKLYVFVENDEKIAFILIRMTKSKQCQKINVTKQQKSHWWITSAQMLTHLSRSDCLAPRRLIYVLYFYWQILAGYTDTIDVRMCDFYRQKVEWLSAFS